MTLTSFLFYILASLTGLCAIAVVVTQNIVRAAAFLLFALCGTAAIFFLLGASFVGATQLLVYVGGTLVLVVFGVMLTAQGPFINMKINAAEWLVALSAALLLFTVLALNLMTMKAPAQPAPEVAPGKVEAGPEKAGADSTTPEKKPQDLASSVQLGKVLLGVVEATPKGNMTGVPDRPNGQKFERARTPMSYLLIFEIVSMHLLVVLIAAAYLARAKRRRGGF
jgi:NADH-quinone oxidoreductase subunit J